jgi:hypothetical protein
MYAIMRVKKHKNDGALKAALQHLYRERDTPNAKKDITNINWMKSCGSTKESIQFLEKAINDSTATTKRKLRKDAVAAVEYLFTASPDFFNTAKNEKEREDLVRKFSFESIEWLNEKWPNGRCIAAQTHLDESTPHLSIFIIPTVLDDDKLKFNAKSVLGGRKKLSEHQTDYAKRVEKFGLKRGVERSKATHTTIQKYYKKLNDVAEIARRSTSKYKEEIDDASSKMTKKTLIELAKSYAAKLTEYESLFKSDLYKKSSELLETIEKKSAKNAEYESKITEKEELEKRYIEHIEKIESEMGKARTNADYKKLFDDLVYAIRHHDTQSNKDLINSIQYVFDNRALNDEATNNESTRFSSRERKINIKKR